MDDLGVDRAGAWLHLGAIFERQLDHAEHALACYRRAAELDPDCATARNAIAANLRARGEHAALVTLLEERLRRAPELEQRAIRVELAGLYALLGERGEAIARYEELRRELPGNLPLLRALEKLYDDARRVHELVDVLEAQAGLVDGARNLGRRSIGAWRSSGSSSSAGHDKAAECWQWLLSFDPACEEAYRRSSGSTAARATGAPPSTSTAATPPLVAPLERRAAAHRGGAHLRARSSRTPPAPSSSTARSRPIAPAPSTPCRRRSGSTSAPRTSARSWRCSSGAPIARRVRRAPSSTTAPPS